MPTFEPHEKVCGNCKLWRAHSIDASKGWVGTCRVQANRGLFPPSAPICDVFAARGEAVAAAQEEAPKPARPRAVRNIAPVIRTGGGSGRQPGSAPRPEPGSEPAGGDAKVPVGPTLVPALDPHTQVDLEGASMTRQELMDLFLEASGLAEVPLAPKWEGGTVRLQPGNPELQAKDIPIDGLFHKVVMIRDRLRTLEQKLNAHPKLTDAEKVDLQQYITRCYGSLTTFNVLFRDKGDQFVGAKGEE